MEEIRALEKISTWTIAELPKGKRHVGCKWFFTVKYKSNGEIDRYMAHQVARGFIQQYGLDYEETFALIAKLNIISILLSMATNLDWPFHQMAIKNAFLNRELQEEVYMALPLGFDSLGSNLVCKLTKSFYGLKQSPRAQF